MDNKDDLAYMVQGEGVGLIRVLAFAIGTLCLIGLWFAWHYAS